MVNIAIIIIIGMIINIICFFFICLLSFGFWLLYI